MQRQTAKTVLAAVLAALSLTAFVWAAVSLCDSRAALAERDGAEAEAEVLLASVPQLDREDYDRRLRRLANRPETVPAAADDADGFGDASAVVTPAEEKPSLWPAAAPYPEYGAILPFRRIVAYYGNFYSKQMGVLGEYPEETVLVMLAKEAAAWEAADPETPVMPAIDYIAVTAQLSPGQDGMHRLRMPDAHIDRAVAMAERIGGIVILEVQPGFANILGEVRALERHLVRPDVHLAIDPEFAMTRRGVRPGLAVGTVDAWEMNEVIDYLSGLVRDQALPPKVLVIHRYTRPMVTNAAKIRPTPEVQVVIDMDGWGPPAQKFSTYNAFVAPEPVQFTGFKLFYKNDTKTGTPLLKPAEILKLTPQPIFIQYQ